MRRKWPPGQGPGRRRPNPTYTNTYSGASNYCADLEHTLKGLEGEPYGRYKSLEHEAYVVTVPDESSQISIHFDRVQGDSFAPPSNLRFRAFCEVDPFWFAQNIRVIAAQDYLTRRLNSYLGTMVSGIAAPSRGDTWNSSRGGKFYTYQPSQNVLARSTVLLTPDFVEGRLRFGLPARGRTIEGYRCADLICQKAVKLVHVALNVAKFESHELDDLRDFVQCIEHQDALRQLLRENNLAAFIPNGACLPRQSGFEDKPLSLAQDTEDAHPINEVNDAKPLEARVTLFESPPTLQVSLPLPDGKSVSGMGLPRGITVLTGGGFHGKTTLLEALQYGIYDKVPGDGREFVSTLPATVKIQAEGGRRVAHLDISGFIRELPTGFDVSDFSTNNASGSTSQAANIIEAVEAGAELLLIDEDSSAANLMQRDAIMGEVISPEMEPICPLLNVARSIYKKHGISFVIVVGSCGAFFSIADVVVQMHNFKPLDITAAAKAACPTLPVSITFPSTLPQRLVHLPSLELPFKPQWMRKILFADKQVILPLDRLDQFVEEGQLEAVTHAFSVLSNRAHENLPLVQTAQEAFQVALQETTFRSKHQSTKGNVASAPLPLMASAISRYTRVNIAQSRLN